MRFIIIGAGAVGASIGGRLAEAGADVVLVARGAHAEALRVHGLTLVTPQGTARHRLPVSEGPQDVELQADDVLLLAVKTQDTRAALETWADAPVAGGGTAAQDLPVVCAQNGVESERMALRLFRRVYGMCVWLPSLHTEPGSVLAPGTPVTGILHLGRYPSGADGTAHAIADAMGGERLSVPVVPDVMRWKYAKLLSNLGNAVEAITGPLDSQEQDTLVQRAVAEGWSVLAAASIACTGRQELDAARSAFHLEPRLVAQRGGGSTWQSLARGTGSVEVDYLNGEIALLGRLHQVATPVNETLQRVANAFAAERRPAGSLPIADLCALVDGADRPR